MALNPEEMKRRRQERAEKRRRQQAQRKKLLIKLGIAGGVLVVCAAVILALTLGTGQTPPATDDDTQPSQPSQTQQDKPAETTVIHLAAVGDLNVTQSVVSAATGDTDFTGALLDVAPLLAHADIAAVNLEGNFAGAPYGTDRSVPQQLAQALKAAGVDAVQLANSYSIYKGMAGLSATVNAVRTAGMEPLGAYADPQEAKAGKGYSLITVQGVKVAFVAFTKGMDGMALPAGSENCVNLLYTDYASDYQKIDTDGITRVLDSAKREKPDIIVAMLHWGSEYNNTVSESQQDICKLLQSQGVDAIIGTHAHYVQQMQFDADSGQFVAYCLGDFWGDGSRSGTEYSVVLDLEITKDNKKGDAKITGFSYTPIFTVAEEGKPSRVVRIREAMAAYESEYIDRVSDSTYQAMAYALGRIEARIAGE